MSTSNGGIKKLGLFTTSAFVIANMIGTGVFTSLGFQLTGITNIIAILSLWVLGGILALCGSLVYSELGAAMPRSGGEYHYLSQIYHPWVGFLSGWVSITVGFAAPVALAAWALGKYLHTVFPLLFVHSNNVLNYLLAFVHVPALTQAQFIGLIVVALITLVHTYDVKFGGNFQGIFTSFKVLLIIVLVTCGFLITPSYQPIASHFASFSFKDLLKPEFAVSLIYVMYAFSGWNASAYIASEIKTPQKTIPRSILASTVIVTVLYFFLNFIFLLTTPEKEMVGNEEVGLIAANHIFGQVGGNIMGLLISVLLVSTISSMIFVGPRVSYVMGEDMQLLKFLSIRSKKHGTPVTAIVLQSAISIILVATSSFRSVLTYAGFTLSLFTFLAVLGVFIHRARYKDAERPYKTWGYPFVPIFFLAIMLWTIVFTAFDRPFESLMGFITVLSGSVIYYLNILFEKKISPVKSQI
jgi:basic amino acid/polyamine antiporter, APA family